MEGNSLTLLEIFCQIYIEKQLQPQLTYKHKSIAVYLSILTQTIKVSPDNQ